MHVGQLCDYGGYVFQRVRHGRFVALALDAVEHRGVERAEAEFRVVHPRVAQNAPQARQLGFEAGVRLAVMRADGEFHQLEMQVVQVLNQVERMFQMPFLLLAFLTEQVRELVQGMADAFPGGVLVFDAANRTAVKMIAKTWLRTAKIKDVGAYFAVSDAPKEIGEWDSRLRVSSRGYMMGYNDLKDPSVSGFFRFLAKVGDNGMKMQIVKIGFGGKL